MIIAINPKNPQTRLIRKVVEVLEKGGIIGYPTDPIYGVGCDLFNPEAIRKIHRLKKSGGKKPLSFICSDLKDISQYAYVSNYAYKTMKVFQRFDFRRNKEDDAAASMKAAELLANSPYKDQLKTARMFIAELQLHSKKIPNLISPRLGDAALAMPPISPDTVDKPGANGIVALPLGGRVKVDPWNDNLSLLKAPPVRNLAEREKMPFEVTPFLLYLTREEK